MKRELYIVRHAKSSWDIENISDIDRPLNLRGIRNAYEMARRLKIERKIPDKFISSPANRALHTASIFVNVFEVPYEKLNIDHKFYEHGVAEILSVIKNEPAELKRLMIFGHNPDISELYRLFAKKTSNDIPTCGIILFTFKCASWKDISRENVISEFIDFPKKNSH